MLFAITGPSKPTVHLASTSVFTPTKINLSHVIAIRGMALTCLVPLRDFKDEIDKRYKAALGSRLSRSSFVRNTKSVQYALFADDEVARFRATIVAKVVSISLLLGVFNK